MTQIMNQERLDFKVKTISKCSNHSIKRPPSTAATLCYAATLFENAPCCNTIISYLRIMRGHLLCAVRFVDRGVF